jgi:hypothetical protein
MQIIDCIILIIHQQLYEYKVEEKLWVQSWREITVWRTRTKLILKLCLNCFTYNTIREGSDASDSDADVHRIFGLTALPPYVSRLSRQCGILNISQTYRRSRPVTTTASEDVKLRNDDHDNLNFHYSNEPAHCSLSFVFVIPFYLQYSGMQKSAQ